MFLCLIDFYFEFLTHSIAFHFHKEGKTKYSSFLVFIFIKELKNELHKNFMFIFTSMVYSLFKSKLM